MGLTWSPAYGQIGLAKVNLFQLCLVGIEGLNGLKMKIFAKQMSFCKVWPTLPCGLYTVLYGSEKTHSMGSNCCFVGSEWTRSLARSGSPFVYNLRNYENAHTKNIHRSNNVGSERFVDWIGAVCFIGKSTDRKSTTHKLTYRSRTLINCYK